MDNARRVIDRLEQQIEETTDRGRLKYDLVTYAIYEARVDQLQALGIMPKRVAELTEKLAILKAELDGKEAA